MSKSKLAKEKLGAGTLVVIPCKLSSKRLPLKNIQKVDWVPLVMHALRAARRALPAAWVVVVDQEHWLIDHLSAQMLQEAGRVLVRPPLWLPKESSAVVALWALMACNFPAKYVALLQPCTLRTPELVRDAMAKLLELPGHIAGLFSVDEAKHLCTGGAPEKYNGGVYIWKVDKLLSECFHPLPNGGPGAELFMFKHPSLVIDIDTALDLKVARAVWPGAAEAKVAEAREE